ncbi:MAG: hypothetical protein OEZ21_00150 [Candidatus Bathyarchaeota archaeon]|nr:hypothetical protein [Candidatus Bathyarchaeota archaeon]
MFLDTIGKLPKAQRGDIIDVLDVEVEVYAETNNANYCWTPSPASLLVCGNNVDMIRQTETIYDLIVLERMLTRLLSR